LSIPRTLPLKHRGTIERIHRSLEKAPPTRSRESEEHVTTCCPYRSSGHRKKIVCTMPSERASTAEAMSKAWPHLGQATETSTLWGSCSWSSTPATHKGKASTRPRHSGEPRCWIRSCPRPVRLFGPRVSRGSTTESLAAKSPHKHEGPVQT
jgi:hypothetical protein